MDIESLLIAIIVLVLLCAIAYAVIKYFGFPIPPIVLQILGWVIAAIILIAIIKVAWPLVAAIL